MKKTILAISITILFFGVGIQPAISNEVTVPQTSDIEKDCGCQSNGKTHLAEKILNRLEKNEILSNDITTCDILPVMNDGASYETRFAVVGSKSNEVCCSR